MSAKTKNDVNVYKSSVNDVTRFKGESKASGVAKGGGQSGQSPPPP